MRKLVSLVVCLLTLTAVACLADEKDKAAAESHKAARAILDRAIKSLGGEARVNRLRTMAVKLRCKVVLDEGEAPFTLDILWQLPDKYRSVMTIIINDTPIIRTITVNGEKGWITVNGQTRDLTSKEIKEAREQMYAETVCKLTTLKESGYQLSALDETQLEGRTLQGVSVVSKDRRDVNLYFDKATGLLVKMEHVVVNPSDAVESSQEVLFLNYRDTIGPRHWGRFIVYNDHQRIFEAEVAEIRYLDKLDERLFKKPAESANAR